VKPTVWETVRERLAGVYTISFLRNSVSRGIWSAKRDTLCMPEARPVQLAPSQRRRERQDLRETYERSFVRPSHTVRARKNQVSPRPLIRTGILLSWARAWTWRTMNLESCWEAFS